MFRETTGRFARVLGLSLLGSAFLAGCGGGGQAPTSGTPIKASPMFRGESSDPAAGIVSGADANSLIRSLGHNHYQLVVTNTSAIGFINTFTWTPPAGATILTVSGSDNGDCGLSHGAISCQLALRPPTCTCRGDGGTVTIGFTAKVRSSNNGYVHGIGMQYSSFMVTSETPVPYIIPSSAGAKPSANADLPFCKKAERSTAAKPCLQHG
jgi:hypothetical protein